KGLRAPGISLVAPPRSRRTRLTVSTSKSLMAMRIPKLRKGSYFPAFLEPRRMAEKALTAVVQDRAPQWRDQAAHRRRRHLPQRGGHRPPRRRNPHRTER